MKACTLRERSTPYAGVPGTAINEITHPEGKFHRKRLCILVYFASDFAHSLSFSMSYTGYDIMSELL